MKWEFHLGPQQSIRRKAKLSLAMCFLAITNRLNKRLPLTWSRFLRPSSRKNGAMTIIMHVHHAHSPCWSLRQCVTAVDCALCTDDGGIWWGCRLGHLRPRPRINLNESSELSHFHMMVMKNQPWGDSFKRTTRNLNHRGCCSSSAVRHPHGANLFSHGFEEYGRNTLKSATPNTTKVSAAAQVRWDILMMLIHLTMVSKIVGEMHSNERLSKPEKHSNSSTMSRHPHDASYSYDGV